MIEILTVIMIAVGLAMDAFAVSVASGSVYRQMHIRYAVRMALFRTLRPAMERRIALKTIISSQDIHY